MNIKDYTTIWRVILFVAEGGLPSVIRLGGALQVKNPCIRLRRLRSFCFHPSASQVGVGLKTKKPGTLYQAFSL